MRIIFRKPPNFNRLCLMVKKDVLPCVLTRKNMKDIFSRLSQSLTQSFRGKFSFSLVTNELLLYQDKEPIIKGNIAIEFGKNEEIKELRMDNSDPAIKIVGQYVKDLFRTAGYVITEEEHSIIIRVKKP